MFFEFFWSCVTKIYYEVWLALVIYQYILTGPLFAAPKKIKIKIACFV